MVAHASVKLRSAYETYQETNGYPSATRCKLYLFGFGTIRKGNDSPVRSNSLRILETRKSSEVKMDLKHNRGHNLPQQDRKDTLYPLC